MDKERDELREAAKDPGLRLRLEDGDEAAERLLDARIKALSTVRFDGSTPPALRVALARASLPRCSTC